MDVMVVELVWGVWERIVADGGGSVCVNCLARVSDGELYDETDWG